MGQSVTINSTLTEHNVHQNHLKKKKRKIASINMKKTYLFNNSQKLKPVNHRLNQCNKYCYRNNEQYVGRSQDIRDWF